MIIIIIKGLKPIVYKNVCVKILGPAQILARHLYNSKSASSTLLLYVLLAVLDLLRQSRWMFSFY